MDAQKLYPPKTERRRNYAVTSKDTVVKRMEKASEAVLKRDEKGNDLAGAEEKTNAKKPSCRRPNHKKTTHCKTFEVMKGSGVWVER